MLLRYIGATLFLTGTLLVAACALPADHRPGSTDPLSPLVTSEPVDRRVLAGEWEYEDGAVVLLTLDEQGNGQYAWKDGRFETRALIGHTWNGTWFQKENDRGGGFTVEFSPDFLEGQGQWWYTYIGTDLAPTQKGGTFHLSKKNALTNQNDTPPAP